MSTEVEDLARKATAGRDFSLQSDHERKLVKTNCHGQQYVTGVKNPGAARV